MTMITTFTPDPADPGSLEPDSNASDAPQSGESAASPLWMDLMAAFSARGVPCWLDSGSLLGMVRGGNLNAWEKDIDVGVWFEDLAPTLEICREFANRFDLECIELQVRGLYYVVLLEDRADRAVPTTLPIAVHVFYRLGNIAWSPQPHSLAWGLSKYPRHRFRQFKSGDKRGVRRALAFAAEYPRYAFAMVMAKLRLSRSISRWVKRQARAHWKQGKHPSDGMFGCAMFDYFQWVVPARFFTHLTTLPGYPHHVMAPEPTEEYLSLRYGNWANPVRQWFYLVDDGCIFPLALSRFDTVKKLLGLRERSD